MVDTPHPIRTAKSSTVGPNQYCGGGPRGNLGCRMFFFFGPFLTMFWSKTWTWRPIVNIPLPHFFGKQADLWRMLGISNVFFTLFFCRIFFFLVFTHFFLESKSKTLRTFLFLVFPHFLADLQADLWRILGISLVFSGSKSNACRTHLPTEKKKRGKKTNRQTKAKSHAIVTTR